MNQISIPYLGYTSMLKFTIDGRPSVEDIHDLFSALITQVTFSTHRYMFRNYERTFLSEDAITQLGALKFTKSSSKSTSTCSHVTTTTTTMTYRMSRGMAKALFQQFLWTRLIDNATDLQSRDYKDNGIWRISPKGSCVLQEFCINTKTDLAQFDVYIDPSIKPMFLIQIERLQENNRLNSKRKHISSLFTIMIASLPLQANNNENSVASSNKLLSIQSSSGMHNYEGSVEDSVSFYSSDSGSTCSSIVGSYGLPSLSDYFSQIKTLSNDQLTTHNGKSSEQRTQFLQQRNFLQNLNPTSNKFKMRSIFPSILCCNWLVDYCTVTSNDEAESIMTEFLNLGWVTFFDEKHRYCQQIESSKSIILCLTKTGMKVVTDVSLEKYNDMQQQQLATRQERNIDEASEARYSFVCPLLNSNSTEDSFCSTSDTIVYNIQESPQAEYKSKITPQLTATNNTNINSTPNFRQFGNSNLDIKPSTAHKAYITITTSTPYESTNTGNLSSTSTPPLTPVTPTTDTTTKESNSIKLKIILKDAHLRSLFQNFLNNNYCAENFNFWIEYDNLRRNYQRQKAAAVMSTASQRQLLEDAYVLWEIYLKPSATHELNIDHVLREEMAEEMPHMVTLVPNYTSGQNSGPLVVVSTYSAYQSLKTVLNWFERVNDQICRLMASDSIPKFVRTPEYKKVMLKTHEEERDEKRNL
ncbi:MAG: regulator of G protein signaling domain-containing protein [Benjaminiella poitrasii]|nr:MAG: regulator of G protein signaling domain-containing protein [Benjaminiella poitrasii]